jgi:hypothetical protein
MLPAQYASLRSRLTLRGMETAQLNSVLGTAPLGRTRQQLAALVRDWLRARPRGA